MQEEFMTPEGHRNFLAKKLFEGGGASGASIKLLYLIFFRFARGEVTNIRLTKASRQITAGVSRRRELFVL